MHAHPELKCLRKYVDAASNNPSTFSKNSNASTLAHEKTNQVLLSVFLKECCVW